jgi:hypothetical protein
VTLLVVALVVPIWSLLDSTVTKGVVDRVLIWLELALLTGWATYLAVSWKKARRRGRAQ